MSESVEAKGHRLLREGHVRVVLSRPGEFWGIVARSDEWIVTYLDGKWWCACPARVPCSHIAAGMLAHQTEAGSEQSSLVAEAT